MGDLLESGAADATAIAELIRRIVVPESWENAGGTIRVDGTKLHIEQTSGVEGHRYDAPEPDEVRTSKQWVYAALGLFVLLLLVLAATGAIPVFPGGE